MMVRSSASRGESASIDIWLVLVIVVLIVSLGGALWLSAKSVMARLDEVHTDLRAQQQVLQGEVFALRKQVQDLEAMARKAAGEARPIAAAPAAAPAPVPAKH
jgi:hypothetical protein